jgi:hypothetical protein
VPAGKHGKLAESAKLASRSSQRLNLSDNPGALYASFLQIARLQEEAAKIISDARAAAQKQVAEAKAAVSAECAKELADAKAVRGLLGSGCVVGPAKNSASSPSLSLLGHTSSGMLAAHGVVGCSFVFSVGGYLSAALGVALACADSQKVDAELARALSGLESEKEAAMKGLDAQVDKLSADILGRVLPEGVRV